MFSSEMRMRINGHVFMNAKYCQAYILYPSSRESGTQTNGLRDRVSSSKYRENMVKSQCIPTMAWTFNILKFLLVNDNKISFSVSIV